MLQTLLRDSIDLDALCIVAWERVFAIRVELRALSYDGNLGDCGALAAIAALAAFRRPDVFVEDNGKVNERHIIHGTHVTQYGCCLHSESVQESKCRAHQRNDVSQIQKSISLDNYLQRGFSNNTE